MQLGNLFGDQLVIRFDLVTRINQQQPAPRWKNPPAKPGEKWQLKATEDRKLAKNAYYAGRDQAPSTARRSARAAASTYGSSAPAPSAAPARPRQAADAAVQRMRKKAALPRPGTSGAEREAKRAVASAATKLKSKYSTARSDTERRKLLAQILVSARSSGDKKTEAWALKTLKNLNQQQLAKRKAGASSKKVATKAKKSAPSRPSASGAPARAKARAESYSAPSSK